MWGWLKRTNKTEVPRTHVCLAVDIYGARYTEHHYAERDDPWYGAVILTPGAINTLVQKGLIPLQEMDARCDR